MATTSVLLEWMLYNNDVMSDVRRLIHKTPNDQDLGNKIREYVSGRDNDRKLATKSHNQFDNTETDEGTCYYGVRSNYRP